MTDRFVYPIAGAAVLALGIGAQAQQQQNCSTIEVKALDPDCGTYVPPKVSGNLAISGRPIARSGQSAGSRSL